MKVRLHCTVACSWMPDALCFLKPFEFHPLHYRPNQVFGKLFYSWIYVCFCTEGQKEDLDSCIPERYIKRHIFINISSWMHVDKIKKYYEPSLVSVSDISSFNCCLADSRNKSMVANWRFLASRSSCKIKFNIFMQCADLSNFTFGTNSIMLDIKITCISFRLTA